MTAPLAAILAERRRRVATLQQKLKAKRLGALLVYDRFNTFYLTGLHCSLSYLLITPREAVLLVDGRYIEVARATVTHLDVRLMTNHAKAFAALQREFNLREVGFEGSTPWSVLQTWQQQIANAQWHEAGDLILDQRLIKSPYEARLIEASARLNDRIYAQALAAVHAGATEIELRNVIRRAADDAGAEGLSFDSIVAAGTMSARPHYDPQARPLEPNHLLLIDMGMLLNSYCSDMTRVVALGNKLKPRLRKIYDAVLTAEQAALDAVGPGVPCAELDRIARESLRARRLHRYFTHGLGHGVGLEIHEAPTLNSRSTTTLRPGMVITIEPGVYIPGLGGVRIEDLVLVTKTGKKILSHSPKPLQLLPI